MPETKIISTLTTTSIIGSAIDIKTQYADPTSLPDTMMAAIASGAGIQDGTPYEQGDLVIRIKNSPPNISYSLDSNGHLIMTNATGDGPNYSVDSNGHLIYTS